MSVLFTVSCSRQAQAPAPKQPTIAERLARYATVELRTDPRRLTPKERRMVPILIEAARIMDQLFWQQAFGDREYLMSKVKHDENARRYVEINYGPWDRLDDNRPFLEGFGPKPPGANFYPPDMTKEQFEAAASVSEEAARRFRSQYTMIVRPEGGGLEPVPYHVYFAPLLKQAAAKLREAAALAEDPGLRRYLLLRAEALLTDDYRASDIAWLEMRNNTLDIIIGPIETYEDRLFGYKAAYEAYVLVKDRAATRRLARYARLLPALQRELPVPEAYKREKPGTEGELAVYDAIFYAGDCNAGSKTIAINLPNDEEIQLRKGTRRLQLRNVMQAKFDLILLPLARHLVAPDQIDRVKFEAFFNNTMFHEIAHGLGIKRTITGKGTVREALKELAPPLEEAKADVLGLYMLTRLMEKGQIAAPDLEAHYITSMAGIFRSIRFGAASAHGVANLIRFNYLSEAGAFRRDPATGLYRVEFEPMRKALESLASRILVLQGDGDYEAVTRFIRQYGRMPAELQADLDRANRQQIPVDVVFIQGQPF